MSFMLACKMKVSNLCYLLFLMHGNHAFIEQRGKEHKELTISGLDCRKPTKVQTGLLRNLCEPPTVPPGNTTQEVMILQRSDVRTLEAVRCEKRITRLTALCGAFSHMKLDTAPDVLLRSVLTTEECEKAANRLLYTKEDGRTMSIDLDREYNYKFMEHGGVTHTQDNIYCKGSKLYVGGEIRANIITFVTAQVIFKSIKVEYDLTTNKMVDLDLHVQIDNACVNADSCTDSAGYSYAIRHASREQCNLHLVRRIPMQRVQIPTESGTKNALVSHDHKIYLPLDGSTEPVGNECAPLLKVHGTNYPNLKVVLPDKHGNFPISLGNRLLATDVDLDIEIKATDEYLAYYFEELLRTQLVKMGQRLCTMNKQGSTQVELSPFHPSSLLKVVGDVLTELQCTPVVAKIRIGEKRTESCYANALPVWLNGNPTFMSAPNHLIVDQLADLDQTNCKSTYLPLFASDNDEIVQADPQVKVVDLTLHHLDSDYLHLLSRNEIIHESFTEDLFYTSSEIERFNRLIHFESTKSKVLDSLTAKYCSTGGNCGAYQPTSADSNFDLSNLEDEIIGEFDLMSQIRAVLSEIGGYTSIIVLLYFTVILFYRTCTVLNLRFTKKIPLEKAVRYTFYLDNHIRDTLLHPVEENVQPPPVQGSPPPHYVEGMQMQPLNRRQPVSRRHTTYWDNSHMVQKSNSTSVPLLSQSSVHPKVQQSPPGSDWDSA